ncbi:MULTISPECIES: Rieske 2Fe-2S domain-containing protein [unclassified Paenibacillus]|uniref:Rieske 2Fe-2S domain-containing protein n=1 Tax=unclassified Paenibacillus TaxID=185978 RepID=UPI001AE9493E|nr:MULTISPECIES: Rieske 2Fe-2S domain-containing protein [unclassified Paenibacillus]MBP1154912.1 5,5'-dehydrodivanillate O-demethylase [Paenibacillus sp. PvP091]MBP1169704.1 5,5'-dehydrodivanillate O-demethylase [Paenibacillus sp. PvR098]MBP2440732.1 5,5'-dehydrodivanillate O-demethylase [Paenibacillus sp. PvP052]
MLSKAKNELLTRVGSGTQGGELLRRYWHPVCPASELNKKPTKRVRILGEDLVIFQDENGDYGCITERCAHRGCSLYYGFVEDGKIRCPYHGWQYDKEGVVTEIPFDNSSFQNKKLTNAYPVQKLSGLLFIYMGPGEPPLLPNWGALVRQDGSRKIEVQPILNCNWLQVQENTADSTHTFYLHGYMASKAQAMGESHSKKEREFFLRPITGYDWKYCDWGIEKKIIYGGDNPGEETRPPLIFPNILLIKTPDHLVQWRVPVDDTHTLLISVYFRPSKDGSIPEQPEEPSVDYITLDMTFDSEGDYKLALDDHHYAFANQDRMAQETQGDIYDRSTEHLGATDRGIIMFRKLLDEQIAVVRDGGEPMGILRDPSKNVCIEFDSTIHALK